MMCEIWLSECVFWPSDVLPTVYMKGIISNIDAHGIKSNPFITQEIYLDITVTILNRNFKFCLTIAY